MNRNRKYAQKLLRQTEAALIAVSQREKRLQVHTENEGGGSGADSKSIHIQRLDIRQHSGRQIIEGVVVVVMMLVVMDQTKKRGKGKRNNREREERKRERV